MFGANHITKKVPLTEYIDNKIFMLEREFCIRLSWVDTEHFYSLKSEREVDQFAHDILMARL